MVTKSYFKLSLSYDYEIMKWELDLRIVGSDSVLLLRPLVPALQTVHPHAGGLLRRGGQRGDRVRLLGPLARGHAQLHEGVPRRLAGRGARVQRRQRAEAEVRDPGNPHPGGGQAGRQPRHQGRPVPRLQQAAQGRRGWVEGLISVLD